MLSSGCSALFVTSAPANAASLPTSEPIECTTSPVAPVVDSTITLLEIARTLYAVSGEGNYSGFPISRGTDIALGAAFATAFMLSSFYGFSTTSECGDAKAAHQAKRRAEQVRQEQRREKPPTAGPPSAGPPSAEPLPTEPPPTEPPPAEPPPTAPQTNE